MNGIAVLFPGPELWSWWRRGFSPAHGGQPCPDVRLGIAVPQTVQTKKPPGSRRADGGVFHIWPGLYRVPLPPQGGQEGVKGEALPDGGVDVLADEAADRGLAPALRVPLCIVLSLVPGLDDGQAKVLAHGVGCASHLSKVTFEVAAVFSAVHEGHRVEYDVTVVVLPVNVGGNHGLIMVSQQAAGKLHPGGVSLFRRYLAGGIGVDKVIPQDAVPFVPATLGSPHFLVGGAGLTVDAGDELVGLLRVFRIGQGIGEAGLESPQALCHQASPSCFQMALK